jgi:hypothetical protein
VVAGERAPYIVIPASCTGAGAQTDHAHACCGGSAEGEREPTQVGIPSGGGASRCRSPAARRNVSQVASSAGRWGKSILPERLSAHVYPKSSSLCALVVASHGGAPRVDRVVACHVVSSARRGGAAVGGRSFLGAFPHNALSRPHVSWIIVLTKKLNCNVSA